MHPLPSETVVQQYLPGPQHSHGHHPFKLKQHGGIVNRAMIRKLTSAIFILLLCLAVSPSIGIIAQAQDQNVQMIEMNAKKYEFSSSPLHVKKGQKIQLKITATDHDHGVKIPATPDGTDPKGAPGLIFTSPQDCWKIKKTESVTIEFTAQTPGTYTFKCCVDCGLGHRHMKGQIIVDE
jgi:heme/copper-type cytochrome/quinol oxidase subunit 2